MALSKMKHRRVLSEHQEILFYCTGNRAPEQVAKGGHGAFNLGDIQKPSGRGPGQLAVGCLV